ncbi:hypothetical protein JOF29_005704 [Kribbella aluminosa]|uniref:Uncharacterized protein n=1 Tax=Kribbella aluminosa TaxID=416017 RepID=A0ABS4USS2_9ACTN|nr:hypothetical protein [Kribbella aluminosa]MBP2354594.1 hypothetical protein [Kribbella aluminosa]
MNRTQNTPEAASSHDTQAAEQAAAASHQTTDETTIDHPSAETFRMKNLDTHPCITIKWSLDSASRRRIGLPLAVAVAAPGATGAQGAGGASC